MNIKVRINSRACVCHADAVYDGKIMTVLAGGKISEDFSGHIQGGKKSLGYRNSREYVDESGNIIKDCVFTSPSTAAQFVTGRSTNGYVGWKVDTKMSLGTYLKEQGLR